MECMDHMPFDDIHEQTDNMAAAPKNTKKKMSAFLNSFDDHITMQTKGEETDATHKSVEYKKGG